MNGREVHSWPGVRVTGRARLSRDGRLLVIGTDDQIKEYDWSGELMRVVPLANEGDLPHHDVIELENGNTLVLALRDRDEGNYLREVNREGGLAWEWRAIDHRDAFPDWNLGDRDPTHINSIRELPANRWFDDGDVRFRPGNILVSARNLNTVFIIDKVEGTVVWRYSDRLVHQHEVSMLEKGLGDAGLILVFNNGRKDLFEDRGSAVLLVEPVKGEVVWQYRADNFFSSLAGAAQSLENGNVLISSSRGGRVFEATPESRIVWEWVPSYAPMRVERLAYDHCPQLAALAPRMEVAVSPDSYRPHVDRKLYQFEGGSGKRELWGRKLAVLGWRNGCQQLRLPDNAELRVDFGFDGERLGDSPMSVVFGVSVEGEKGHEKLLEAEVRSGSEDGLWQRQSVDLSGYAYESVELCLSVRQTRGGHPCCFGGVVGNARDPVGSTSGRRLGSAGPAVERRTSAAKEAARGRRLRELKGALGSAESAVIRRREFRAFCVAAGAAPSHSRSRLSSSRPRRRRDRDPGLRGGPGRPSLPCRDRCSQRPDPTGKRCA
jgi:hypothetical protein